MFRLIVHMLFFAAGLGVGIWWSAAHPMQAQAVATQEQIQAAQLQSAAQAKIDTLQQLITRHTGGTVAPSGNTAPSDAELQQMLEQAKKDKVEAEQKSSQP